MNDEELIERIVALNYREFGANVGNDLKRIIIKKEDELERYKNIIKLLKHFGENSLGIIYALKDNVEPTENEWLNLIEYEKYLRELKGDDK